MKMRKTFKLLSFILLCMFVMSCSKGTKKENEVDLTCNDTSGGKMAETKNGYFSLMSGGILYYCDKSDLTNWVAVCNKPDCMHEAWDIECNAYMPSGITQKGDKLYGITMGNAIEGTYIFEIKTDGSGIEKIYSFPEDDEIETRSGMVHAFHEQMVWYYSYLDEFGMCQKRILAIRENEKGELVKQLLYENTLEELDGAYFPNAKLFLGVNGDDLVFCSLLLDENEKTSDITNHDMLVRIGETSLEKVNVPKDVNLFGSYISGDNCIYYEENKGFYHVNLSTGEKTLLFENQLTDARGYIFNETCMIECNRREDKTPEKAELRFYNGTEWKEIELPEAVKNASGAFYPNALASDRIFYQHEVEKGEITVIDWYYFEIEKETPELVYIGEIPSTDRKEGNNSVEETTEVIDTTEAVEDTDSFKDIIISENEDYLYKITNAYIKEGNYCIDIYGKNKKKKDIQMCIVNSCTINGIQCSTSYSLTTTNEISSQKTIINFEDCVEKNHVSDIYTADEYTKIEVTFQLMDSKVGTREVKTITLYPKGEENVTLYQREPMDTDVVLVDNDDISIILTGYETGFLENDTVKVYFINKTDQCIRAEVKEAAIQKFVFRTVQTVEDEAEIIGIKNLTQTSDYLFELVMEPNTCAIQDMTLFDENENVMYGINDRFFKSNNITSIDEIKMKLRVYPYDVATFTSVGEDFFNDEIILKP